MNAEANVRLFISGADERLWLGPGFNMASGMS